MTTIKTNQGVKLCLAALLLLSMLSNGGLLWLFSSTRPRCDHDDRPLLDEGRDSCDPLLFQEWRSRHKKGNLFVCGWEYPELALQLFPDYHIWNHPDFSPPQGGKVVVDSTHLTWTIRNSMLLNNESLAAAQRHDLLVYGMHGPCLAATGNASDRSPAHILSKFPGPILFINGEPFGDDLIEEAVHGMNHTNSCVYQIGPYKRRFHTMPTPYLSVLLASETPQTKQKIFDQTKRPQHNGSDSIINAVAYFTSNCVPYRQRAAAQIVEIANISVHSSAKCQVPGGKGIVPDSLPGPKDRHKNSDIFSQYKYCLVMENTAAPMYMTEKLLNAFLGGCLPIYYGTKQVLDIFNPNAFVFYDVENPQPALKLLKQLQADQAKYDFMLRQQPILKNGNVTLAEYFSFSHAGRLRYKIRRMMSMEPCHATNHSNATFVPEWKEAQQKS